MKPLLFLFALLLLLSQAGRAQDTTAILHKHSASSLKEYYKKRSYQDESRRWAMLSTGAGMAGFGIALYSTNQDNENPTVTALGMIATMTGARLIIGSIPSFMVAAHYKRKMLKASFGLKFSHGAPGLALKIKL